MILDLCVESSSIEPTIGPPSDGAATPTVSTPTKYEFADTVQCYEMISYITSYFLADL